MSDLDLASLTEAVTERLDSDGDLHITHAGDEWAQCPVERVVRAVLEALPREWGVQQPGLDATLWTRDRESAESVRRYPARLVWRAVGPPIPAEDAP